MNTETITQDTADIVPERLQLDRHYDVERLQQEVYEIVSSLTIPTYTYYSPVPLVFNVKDPENHDWDSENMLKGCSYLKEILSCFQTEITSVRLMRLAPGAIVHEHRDPTLDAIHKEVIRLTLPIYSNNNTVFLLNGTEINMNPGELWYMKLSEPHSVHNNDQMERINMSIDLVWNDWLSNWFAEHLT